MQRHSRESAFGFLSTLETAEYGYFGGYLIVNVLGRPLEFHCTAPVRPSRAQEILYGPTLQSYLLGDQMGAALLREAKLKPDIVLTDQAATLSLRASLEGPIVMVHGRPNGSLTAQEAPRRYTETLNHCRRFVAFGYEIQLAEGFDSDQPRAAEFLGLLAEHVDLAEPFDRIREAIREASRMGDHGQEHFSDVAA